VRVALPDGEGAALTCATCHVRATADGRLIVGAGNDRLELGRLMVDGDGAVPPELAQSRRAWGPGRVDVTTEDGGDPVRIPDLRPVRWHGHLHYGASVAQPDEIALAVRIETLLITAHGGAVRPPREIALGLALYLRALADGLPTRVPETVAARRGAALFEARCAGCHRGPAFTGPPVSAARAGTDPRHAQSPDRGTGRYRVPSLRGVGTRGPLLHDGSAAGLSSLFGELAPADRGALVAYLETL
jgi:mono/diheme cytochrome c family protein